MSIQNFPASLVPAIQTGMLEHEFEEALRSYIGYRMIADRETIATNIGETLTKTRRGLKAPMTIPMVASANTNFDNGLTPSTFAIEQYTLTLQQFGDTIDLNMITNKVGIVNQFLQNAKVTGVQAAQSLDRLARRALFIPYFGGNTRVSLTNGSVISTVNVDDVRGFFQVPVNGVMVATSAGAPLAATIGAATVSIIGVVADGTVTNGVVSGAGNGDGNVAPAGLTFGTTGANLANNVSTAPGGFSGVLTLSATITVANATLGNTVQAANASQIVRPSGRANTGLLQATDTLTLSNILDAVALMRLNNVPGVASADGTTGAAGHDPYNFYLDPKSSRQLFADPDFKQLFQGATSAAQVFKTGMTNDFLGVRFMPTTEAFTQTLTGVGTVRRPILVGGGALIEGDYAGMATAEVSTDGSIINTVDEVVMVTRPPLDRLQQIIAQSWYWIGAFTAPSDITTNTNIIPTATNSAFKRAVMIEHIG
jgi:hypothetical protein